MTAKYPSIAVSLANMADTLQTLIEASAGYREKLEAAGYSPTVAEQLAAQYHSALMSITFKNILG